MLVRRRQLIPKPLLSDLKLACLEQAVLLLVTSLLLDGGDLFRWTCVAFLGYWCGVAAIAIKRTHYSSRTDRFFVLYGSFVLVIIAVIAEPWIHRYIRW
jgi:hypothetical protein